MNKVKTIFFGSSNLSKQILETIQELDYIDLVGVITQPDKEFGRKKDLKQTVVSEYVNELNKRNSGSIKLFKPLGLNKEGGEILELTKPELIIVAAYSKILPQFILDYPKFKCLNLHGSILPNLRGAVPIQKAILSGFKRTGVTLQVMKFEMDEGDILATKEFDISINDNSETLMNKAAEDGSQLLKSTLPEYLRGTIKPIKQNPNNATYCYLSEFSYDNSFINWSSSALDIERKVRAFYPDPICHTKKIDIKRWDNKNIEYTIPENSKIYQVGIKELTSDIDIDIGSAFIENNEIFVVTSSGLIKLIEIQLPGKNKVKTIDFLNGIKNNI